jgi:hypothetical protein
MDAIRTTSTVIPAIIAIISSSIHHPCESRPADRQPPATGAHSPLPRPGCYPTPLCATSLGQALACHCAGALLYGDAPLTQRSPLVSPMA